MSYEAFDCPDGFSHCTDTSGEVLIGQDNLQLKIFGRCADTCTGFGATFLDSFLNVKKPL